MDEEVPLLAAVALAALQFGCGALVAVVTRRAADGRLGRNHVAGIRTAATLRSDAAWREGHAAAVGLSDRAGVAFAAGGLLSLVFRAAPVAAAALIGGVVVGTSLLLLGAQKAGRAAAAAP